MKEFWTDFGKKLLSKEFLGIAATVVFALYESDMIDPETGLYKLLAIAVAIFGVLGYGLLRTSQKRDELKAKALVDAVKAGAKPPDPPL